MNKEELEKHKVITAHFMAITNHIESLNNKNYAFFKSSPLFQK